MNTFDEFRECQRKLERESRSTGPFDIACVRCHGEKCDEKLTTYGVCVPCLKDQLRTLLHVEDRGDTYRVRNEIIVEDEPDES